MLCSEIRFSWPKTLVKKWLNIKNRADDFHADNVFYEERTSTRSSDGVQCTRIDFKAPQVTDVQNYRIFVATWNVAGKSPTSHLNLEDWLHTSPPAEIYVLGFQEIVPLNAGNVLGTEDDEPAKRWLALIRRTLNHLPSVLPVPDPVVKLNANCGGSMRVKASTFFHRRSIQSTRVDNHITGSQSQLHQRFSVCDTNHRWFSSDDENPCELPVITHGSRTEYYNGSFPMDESDSERQQSRYCLVASKQMVGIYLTVWVRSELRNDVRNMKVSCVGRGLMGYLGNKGSISISMTLHETSFCFVCSHLTSGQKEGDELRRNCDVLEILKQTRFPRAQIKGDEYSPQTILEHDRVIWLGDLNYRIALSYRCAKAHVEMRNWKTLLENDQLRIEQRRGRVFEGWREGKIHFPPTYKYTKNSDIYAGADARQKQKRRTPAWCDRILWHGKGIRQLSYVRGESKFSDHRPVYSLFMVEVESSHRGKFRKSTSCSSARVEVEELLPFSHGHGGLNFD